MKMTKYYCKCLNVSLEYDVIDRVNDCPLSKEEKIFLSQLPFVLEISLRRCKILKQQSALIDTKLVGLWNFNKCINCSIYTHAEKIDASLTVLVNNSLRELNDQELYTIKQSVDFSPVFNIVISNHSCLTEYNEPSHSIGENSNVIINELRSHLSDVIDEQKVKTDALIKKYVREQEEAFRNFVLRANNDFQIVKIAVIKNRISGEVFKKNNSACDEPKTVTIQDENTKNTVISSDASITLNKLENGKKDRNSTSIPEFPASLDSEGLFLLDDMEHDNIPDDEEHSDEDQSDTDDSGSRDEGIHIPRSERMGIAKSLPINVRTDFDHSMRYFDDRFDYGKSTNNRRSTHKRKTRPERPVDIAASMKALANSVHGDTIFGDLPPPRIGSRI